MPGDDVVAVVREWVGKAEDDLLTAVHTLELGERCPTEIVCFHAQQCVEEYLKALLVVWGIEIPRTHDVFELTVSLPERLRPDVAADEQDRLTEYATVTRHPGDYEPIPLSEARRAVAVARGVRADVRGELPPEALRGR